MRIQRNKQHLQGKYTWGNISTLHNWVYGNPIFAHINILAPTFTQLLVQSAFGSSWSQSNDMNCAVIPSSLGLIVPWHQGRVLTAHKPQRTSAEWLQADARPNGMLPKAWARALIEPVPAIRAALPILPLYGCWNNHSIAAIQSKKSMQKLQCAKLSQCDKIISGWEEIFKIALTIADLTNQPEPNVI